MMTSADQWDWKISAPEFVPGNVNPGVQCDIIGPIQPTLHDNGTVQPAFGPFSAPCGPMGAINAPGLMCNNGLGPFVGGNLGQMPPEPHGMMANNDNAIRPMLPGPPAPSPMQGLTAPSFSPGLPQPQQPMNRPPGPRGFIPFGPEIGMPLQQNSMPGRNAMGFEDPNAVGQMRAHYEWQMQVKEHELRDLQRRLGREEVERLQMQQEFERDRDGLLQHVNKLAAAVEKAGISVENKAGQSSKKVLQTKMDKLNNLLQKPSEDVVASMSSKGKGNHKGYQGQRQAAPSGLKSATASGAWPQQKSQAASSNSSTSIAPGQSGQVNKRLLGDRTGPSSTLRPFAGLNDALDEVQVPAGIEKSRPSDRREDDRIESSNQAPVDRSLGIAHTSWSSSSAPSKESRTPAASSSRMPADREELERAIRDLARCSGDSVDGEIREAVESLANGPGGIAAVRQAVRRVEELAQGEDGRCSNFVSVLQGVCRKIRRRFEQPTVPSSASRAPAPGDSTGAHGDRPQSDRRQGPNATTSFSRDGRDQRGFARGTRDKRIVVSDRAQAKHQNHWSAARFEKLSRQGSFELRRRDDSSWELQIAMSELEPPLTDEGMQVFCRWFHGRMAKVKEQLGQVPLRDVVTEVNFSRNALGDEAIGRLLQALQRSDLQITSLNLFANRIGPSGARYITDFLWSASSAVQELHLSHNELDDESAIEILRLLAEHPRYPPKVTSYGGKEIQFPVWVRMNNNWIQDSGKVLKSAENELGVSACLARNKHTCGLRKCGRRGGGGASCPLVHLYLFDTQDSPRESFQASAEVAPPTASSSNLPRPIEERFLPGHSGPVPSDAPPVPPPPREKHRGGVGQNSNVGTPSSIASSALNRRSDANSDAPIGALGATAKPVSIPQIMVAPGRSSATDGTLDECDPTETGGVPEQTPEPDEVGLDETRPESAELSQACGSDLQMASISEVAATVVDRPPTPPAPEEEPPQAPLRPLMTAPTRILRRDAPQVTASQPVVSVGALPGDSQA